MKKIVFTIIVISLLAQSSTALAQGLNVPQRQQEIDKAAATGQSSGESIQATDAARRAASGKAAGESAAASGAATSGRAYSESMTQSHPEGFGASDDINYFGEGYRGGTAGTTAEAQPAQEEGVTVTRPPIYSEQYGELKLPYSENSSGEYLQQSLLPNIASIIVSVTGGISLVFVIIGGIMLLTSYGDPDKAKKGKATVMYALIGIVLSVLSYAIVAIISSINV